jgi:CRP-like cAMP-binding protein
MIDKMIEFLEQYTELSPEECEMVIAANKVKQFYKKEIVKSFIDKDTTSFFVLSGILYSSLLIDGKENVGDFYFAGDPVIVPPMNEDLNINYQLVCLEDCSLAVSSDDQTDKLLLENPKLERVCRLFAEDRLNNYYSLHNNLKNLSATERYDLIQRFRPHIIDQVPHYLLANYLGISPETLSRVRNK